MAADRQRERRREGGHEWGHEPSTGRGHDPELNDTGSATADVLSRIRPHLQTLGILLAIVAGGFAAWTLIAAQRAATAERSWDECMAALSERNPDRLDEVMRKYPGTAAARWSQMLLAETAITEGCQQLFGDRARGRQRLENAVGIYTAILAERPGGLVGERAVFGLAKAREALGELDEAKRGYQSLLAEYPSSAVRGLAEQRIAALSRDTTRDWYDWFAAVDLTPPAAPVGDGVAPVAPEPADKPEPESPTPPEAAPPSPAGEKPVESAPPAAESPADGTPAAGLDGASTPTAPAG